MNGRGPLPHTHMNWHTCATQHYDLCYGLCHFVDSYIIWKYAMQKSKSQCYLTLKPAYLLYTNQDKTDANTNLLCILNSVSLIVCGLMRHTKMATFHLCFTIHQPHCVQIVSILYKRLKCISMKYSFPFCCTTSVAKVANRSETAAIDKLTSSWTENISVWFSLWSPGSDLLSDMPSVF